MTRADRLAQAEAHARELLDVQRRKLAQVQAAQRAEERKARGRRYLQVGKMADDTGLLVLDDTTLSQLFVALTPLTRVPDPVAVLTSLLCDARSPALESVEGSAHATMVFTAVQ